MARKVETTWGSDKIVIKLLTLIQQGLCIVIALFGSKNTTQTLVYTHNSHTHSALLNKNSTRCAAKGRTEQSLLFCLTYISENHRFIHRSLQGGTGIQMWSILDQIILLIFSLLSISKMARQIHYFYMIIKSKETKVSYILCLYKTKQKWIVTVASWKIDNMSNKTEL